MIDMDMKKFFFDRPEIIAMIDKKKRQALSKAGAFIKRDARQSMRKAPFLTRKPRGQPRTDLRRKYSQPGKPPYSRTNPLLKKRTLFAYDPTTESLVVGPEKLPRFKINKKVPEVLEKGGKAKVKFRRGRGEAPAKRQRGSKRISDSAVRAIIARRKRSERRRVTKTVRIAKRPYMRPAYEKNLAKIVTFFDEKEKAGGF